MDRKDFDTKEGIAAKLGSYDELYGLLSARRSYAIVNAEEIATAPTDEAYLHAFYIFGLICTDQNGQVVRLNPEVFDEARRDRMPAVMTEDEFLEFADSEGIEFGTLFARQPDR